MRYLLFACLPLLIGCSLVSSIDPTAIPVATAPESTVTVEPIAPPATSTEPVPTPLPAVPSAFPDASAYAWTLVADGFRSPVDVQDGGDGRLYVVEQAGVIQALSPDGQAAGVVLDIRDRVGSTRNEQGLLGLAFDPAAAGEGFFYVNYTDLAGDTVISRFQRSGESADPSSETVVLRYDQPYPNHNGGGVSFGPDGYLYIGSGDGGSAGDPEERAQNLDSLLGKILRLDVGGASPYAIPSDNPFSAGGGRPEIWAFGLRNPWRFAFDPLTGALFIGDVGQGQWEEIDHLPAGSPGGANFGWDFREGFETYESSPPAGLTDPVAVYSHADGCSVTGGVVVRDPALIEWNGIYLYGDYCSGTIWGLFLDDAGVWQNSRLFQTSMNITSFGTDASGRVYVVDRNGGIYRLTAQGG